MARFIALELMNSIHIQMTVQLSTSLQHAIVRYIFNRTVPFFRLLMHLVSPVRAVACLDRPSVQLMATDVTFSLGMRAHKKGLAKATVCRMVFIKLLSQISPLTSARKVSLPGPKR